ncbi:MAG: iron ABC transporter permease [Planctomycetes bacterium]|nr:iron ABC transporter permease [Planctomycetota bacterium]
MTATAPGAVRPRVPLGLACALLAALTLALGVLQLLWGEEGAFRFDLGTAARGALAALGLGAPLDDPFAQNALAGRLIRGVVAAGVGALLAVAGALLQGFFRNGLASPSLIGVTAGAQFGATLGILALGGYGVAGFVGISPAVITAAALVGALAVCALVVALGTGPGRGGVATLLLIGVAVNTCLAGLMSAAQELLLQSNDYDVLRAIGSWTFGTLDDRQPYHLAMVGVGLAVTIAILPFVATELDLLASGDEDAAALGVAVRRTRALVLLAAASATACAVAVAGQVGFLGLVVPHAVRLLVGASHRRVLPLSMFGGACFLLLADFAQLAALGQRPLGPGVVMSLIGGPVFLALLLTHRRSIAW